jgi:hypothetical protein
MLLERARREVRSNGRQAPGEKKVKNTLGHKRADSLVEKMQELWDKKKGRTYGALSRGQRKKQGGQREETPSGSGGRKRRRGGSRRRGPPLPRAKTKAFSKSKTRTLPCLKTGETAKP